MIVWIITILLVALGVYFLFFVIKDLIATKGNWGSDSIPVNAGIGLITDFLDTLGIGSFAPSTLLFRVTKQVKDDALLPGTLNTGHTIPVICEALIFIQVVKVEPITLFALIIAAMVGSWIGSRTVSKMPAKRILTLMGFALLVTAVLMALRHTGILDAIGKGNEAFGLTGVALIIGVVGNFIFGALMTIGVGLYAPCMAMIYMLGLNPIVAFPVMMGSCAALMPIASAEFIKTGKYSRNATIGLTIGGVVGVIIAAFFVTSIPMDILTWVIIVVVAIAGVDMVRKGFKKDDAVKA